MVEPSNAAERQGAQTPWYIWAFAIVILALLVVQVGQVTSLQVDTTTVLLVILLILLPNVPRMSSLKYGDLEVGFGTEQVRKAEEQFETTLGTIQPMQVLEAGLQGSSRTEEMTEIAEQAIENAKDEVKSEAYERYRYLPGAGLVEVLRHLQWKLGSLTETDTSNLDRLISELRTQVKNGEFQAVGDELDMDSVDSIEDFLDLSTTGLDNYCDDSVTNDDVRALMELGIRYYAELSYLAYAETRARSEVADDIETEVQTLADEVQDGGFELLIDGKPIENFLESAVSR